MYKYTITNTDNGYEVYIDMINSPAGHYLSRRPYIMNLIKEAITDRDLKEETIILEIDMGRDIGKTDIVSTTDNDNIYYAMPIKQTVYSRFAKNKYAQNSHKLSIILVKDPKGDYEVRDTWIGPLKPPFPGDDLATKDSKQYWETHALVHDAQIIQTKTITKNCPY